MHRFERSLTLPVAREELFAWHRRPGAFERLSPSWEQIEIVAREGSIEDGDLLCFRLRKGPLRITWKARHRGHVPGRKFEDVAERSPFAHWHHVHAFEDAGGSQSTSESSEASGDRARDAATLRDRVEFRLPFDRLSWPLVGGRVEAMLEQMFRQRHVRTANDLRRHQGAGRQALRVAVTGSSGLIGRELRAFLSTGGHELVPVVRRAPGPGEIRWDPERRLIEDPAGLEGLDAVVHLAGEPVGARWTRARKRRILESRSRGTRLLCETLARRERKPRVLVCASGIGFYGDAGEAELDERAPMGAGFLAEVAREWETATEPAREAGIRVVLLRIGVVISARGGALARLRVPFGLGLGGRIGSGRQWLSWIDLDDLVGVIHHAIRREDLRGPVNAVAPAPVRQAEFARNLARVLKRPALLPLPTAAVRGLFGELGSEVLLASQRVRCAKLLDSGFGFDFPTLERSLRHQLGRDEAEAVEQAVARFEAQREASSQAAGAA